MDFLLNELSVHGQFVTQDDFYAAVDRIMTIRTAIRHAGRELYCHRSLANAKVTVEQALKHRLDQEKDADGNTVQTRASELLRYTICEPALGSGAFLNEAQVRQDELASRIQFCANTTSAARVLGSVVFRAKPKQARAACLNSSERSMVSCLERASTASCGSPTRAAHMAVMGKSQPQLFRLQSHVSITRRSVRCIVCTSTPSPGSMPSGPTSAGCSQFHLVYVSVAPC
jgi:hypothetical protein